MRVCLITPGFSVEPDDNCIPALRTFALELARRHEVTVVALRYPHRQTPYQLGPLRVLPLGGANISGPRRLLLLRRALQTVRRAGPFDVIQGCWADEPGWVAQQAAQQLGARSVISLMGGELARLPTLGYGGETSVANRWLQRQALRRGDVITAGSHWLQERAALRLGRPVHWLPLGLAPRETTPRSPSEGPLTVIGLGSMVPVKGFETLVRGCATAQRRGAALRLWMVGDGPQRATLTALGERLGLDAQWFGEVPWAEVSPLLSQADLLLQTSWWESQGMATLEAAQAGCAVAGTQVGALAHLQSSVGTLAAGDVEGLAQLLLGVEREQLAAAGRAAAEEVERSYSLRACVARWQAAVDDNK